MDSASLGQELLAIGRAKPYRGFAPMNADREGKTLPLIVLMTRILKKSKAKSQEPRARKENAPGGRLTIPGNLTSL